MSPRIFLAGVAWLLTFVMLVAFFFDWVTVNALRVCIAAFCFLVALFASVVKDNA